VTAVSPNRALERLTWDLLGVFDAARLPVNTEAELQAAIAKLLDDAGIAYVREVKVAGGRIDFLAGYRAVAPPDGRAMHGCQHLAAVGIEVKIAGGKRAIHRQCAAYCRDPRIGHLVVVAGLALALPAAIHGKPVTIVQIGKAWL
jgi:hypothetical protein